MRRKVLFVLGAAFLLRAPALVNLPTPGDEVSYAAGASVITHGGVLYRDFFDHKPPLIYYTFAAAFRATSDYNLVAVHLLAMLFVAATALVVGRTVRKHFAPDTPHADLIAALLYIAYSATFVDFAALDANAEIFLNLPLALALSTHLAWRASRPHNPSNEISALEAKGAAVDCFSPRRADARFAFATGMLIAVATLYKYQASFVGVAVAIDLLRARHFDGRRELRSAAAFAVGGLAPVALVVALFAAADALGPLWRRGILYNFQFLGDAPPFTVSLAAFGAAVLQVIVPAAPLYIFAVRAALRAEADGARSLRWWIVALAPAVAMGGRFFPHYFLILLVPLAALAAGPIAAALVVRRNRRLALSAAIPIVGLTAVQWDRPAVARAVGLAEPAYADVVTAIQENSAVTDRIFVWGQAYPIYSRAKRTPAARLIFWGFRARDDAPPSKFETDLLAGILDDLTRRNARIVVDVGAKPFRQEPALAAYVAQHFRLTATFNGARVFVRRMSTVP